MEHITGKGIDGAIRLIHSRRLKKWGAKKAPFKTRAHLKRFTALASMITERDVRVVDIKGDPRPAPYRPILHKLAHPALLPDHGFGFSDYENIFLPVSIVDMPAQKEQEELTKLLLFSLSAQIKWGSLSAAAGSRTLLTGDRVVSDLYWIIENTRLFFLIRENFPGVLRGWEDMSEYLLNRRPAANCLNRAEKKVEEFLEESLSLTLSGAPYTLTPQESLLLAEETKQRWVQEGIKFKRYRAMVPFAPWGRLIPEKIVAGKGTNEGVQSGERKEPDTDTGASDEKKSEDNAERSRYMVQKETVDEEENKQGILLNIYDKVVSWGEFVNVTRPFDDEQEDDNSKKADDMEELTTAEVQKATSSFLNAELESNVDYADETPEPGAGLGVYTYPEWDYKSRAYKVFSTISESVVEGTDDEFVKKVLREKGGIIKEIKRRFEALTPTERLKGRQYEGDIIDLDAAVEAITDLAVGKQPDERLYATYRREERDISVLFLVDLSMSTSAWVKTGRIIDHEKEALVMLCEAMQKVRERYAIYGFSGKTRKKCTFLKIKDFAEPYNEEIKKRIGGLIPYHYTRMGPAIRHAGDILKKEHSQVKLMIMLSDGKPNDLDSYEGRYGIEDTRMAIKEVEKQGVVPICLTVDTSPREYLPQTFGKGNYAVIWGADRLVKTLPELYARIIQRL